ncbi:MAG: hypothetical protein H0Z37_07975 [Firmicutes bacterium]|nr:hypothetical protein [Bacillota bacterium]
MGKPWLFRLAAGLAAAVWTCAAAGSATAQVLVGPARIEALVESGTRLAPIRVENRGDKPVRIVAYTGFGDHDLGGAPIYYDDAEARAASAQYLHLDPPGIRLEPGDVGFIHGTVRLPAGFSGSLYPVVFLEVRPDAPGWPGTVQAVTRVAVVTLLYTKEAYPRIIAEEALVRPHPDGDGLEVAVRVRNEGNRHGLASGTVSVEDGTGTVLARLPLTPGLVLPGSRRELVSRWLPPDGGSGRYRAVVQVDGPGPPVEVAFALGPALALAGGTGR